MRCNQCGSEIKKKGGYFHCNVDGEDYCNADCCIDSLIGKGYIEMLDDGTFIFEGEDYEAGYELLFEIGSYVVEEINKNRKVFELKQAAIDYAKEVGGKYRMVQLPDYMRVEIIYVVEW